MLIPTSGLRQSKKEGKDQGSIQSSTTPYPGYQIVKCNKIAIKITYKSQEVRPFPASDHKAPVDSRKCMTNTRHK